MNERDIVGGSVAAWETVDQIREIAKDMGVSFLPRSDFAEHLAECLDVHYNMGRAFERALKILNANALERQRIMVEALEQAQDCILGETPEDCGHEDARQDTLQKIRQALGL